MSVNPPPRTPDAHHEAMMEVIDTHIDRALQVYSRVFAACAGFGMSEEVCARYARAAVSDFQKVSTQMFEALK